MSRSNRATARYALSIALDALLASLSFILAVYLRLGSEQWELSDPYLINSALLSALIVGLLSFYTKLYRSLWRYVSMPDMLGVVRVATLGILLLAAAMFIINRLEGLPRSVLFIHWLLLMAMLAAPRFLYRLLNEKPLSMDDLLGREAKTLDRSALQSLIHGRTVLITGAGGTIGSELARQMAAYEPGKLVLLEISEYHLYQIEREITEAFPKLALATALCDVRDAAHVNHLFNIHQPELVFHAAAIKHVPIAELNIEETILTNVLGTKNIADACLAYGVDSMVLISTDKAVNPASIMGASKRLAESICQAFSGTGATRFLTVRFGNVLGSTGSVVPLFQEQIEKGGPITVTHPDMVRYFMTVQEAVSLVLQTATLRAQSESIFVLNMGKPVKIIDLATQMIRLAGLLPHEDIKIIFTGLRPGEKLYEELFHILENADKTTHESIFLCHPRFVDLATLGKELPSLFDACKDRNAHAALAMLKTLVPEFQSLHPTSII